MDIYNQKTKEGDAVDGDNSVNDNGGEKNSSNTSIVNNNNNNNSNTEKAYYYVDCKPGNKYASPLVKDEKLRKETMEAVNQLIDNALGKKRKMQLREATSA